MLYPLSYGGCRSPRLSGSETVRHRFSCSTRFGVVQTVHLVVNPVAHQGLSVKVAAKAGAIIESTGHEVLVVTPKSATGIGAALDRTGVPVERIIGVGGDGLVHAIVGEAVQRQVPLGLVPSGSGNDFGRAFGLPKRLKKAVAVALSDARPVDLLRVGDRYVASVATAGFSADVNERANGMSFPPGQSKYAAATLLQIPKMSSFPITIENDGVSRDIEVSMIAIANTAYFGGGMKVCPTASATDGLLDILTVGPVGKLEMLAFLPTTFWGGHMNHRAVESSTASQLTVTMPDDVQLWGDGEPMSLGPFTVSIAPGCLLLAGAR